VPGNPSKDLSSLLSFVPDLSPKLSISDPNESIAIQTAVETDRCPGMAGRPGGQRLDNQRILIAINQDLLHPKHMPRCFTLHPEAFARPGMKMRKASFPRLFQCLSIHKCHHQHIARVGMRHNRGQQAAFIEFGQEPSALLTLGSSFIVRRNRSSPPRP
jgi:hypothetical protein